MSRTFAVLFTLLFAACGLAARAGEKTLCTITVNSADEKEAFRERLPKGRYRIVELVEKGRGDWLRMACAAEVKCDLLVISGHFNAGEFFYSDRIGTSEHLRIDELERASCSESCPSLFSRLKEVYLFGCESLNPDASTYASSAGDSGRDRMRRIFANVPVIYGFASSAPVGPTAAMLLNRYFDSGVNDLGTGRPSSRLLRTFSGNGMTATRGVPASQDPASERNQVCRFFDERLTPARKLSFIHETMRRDMEQAVGFLERTHRLLASLTGQEREAPSFLHALAVISADDTIRASFLAAGRATADPLRRARMISLAAILGWLSPEERRAELVGLIDDVLARRAIGFAEVDLVCALNSDGDLGEVLSRVSIAPSRARHAAGAAVLACLGDGEARTRVLAALASADDGDVQVAQAYLRQRPATDPKELRALARAIARMPGTGAQIRALDTLGRLDIDDREITDGLTRSFAAARSVGVQRAIAEIFLRSGAVAVAQPELLDVLRRHRIKSPGGEDLVDVLIGRLQAAS